MTAWTGQARWRRRMSMSARLAWRSVPAGVGLALILGLPAPTQAQTSWAQFRNGADHRGVQPYEHTLDPATVGGLALAWRASTWNSIYGSSPAVVAGVVYVGSYDGLFAFSASSGGLLWMSPTGREIYASSPAVANGRVFVGAMDGALYAFDATSGALLWPF